MPSVRIKSGPESETIPWLGLMAQNRRRSQGAEVLGETHVKLSSELREEAKPLTREPEARAPPNRQAVYVREPWERVPWTAQSRSSGPEGWTPGFINTGLSVRRTQTGGSAGVAPQCCEAAATGLH